MTHTLSTHTNKISQLAARITKRMSKETEREFKMLARELESFYKSMLDELRSMTFPTYTYHPSPGMEAPVRDIHLVPGKYEPVDFHSQPLFQSVIAPRIVSLLKKLEGISYKFTFYGLDAEDTLQSVCLALLEKAAVEPEFASQEDAYICQYAKWSAWHLLQSTKTYNDYVEAEKWTVDSEGEEVSEFEYIPCTDPEPEQRAESYESERLLAEVVRQLAPENRVVVKMLYVGYSRAEIASKLQISRPAVTQRIKTIQKALRPVCKEFGLAAYATI